jgi:hypothetical protein
MWLDGQGEDFIEDAMGRAFLNLKASLPRLAD